MKKFRGFLLKRHVRKLVRCVFRRNCSPPGYHRLDPPQESKSQPISKLCSWAQCLRTKAKAICSKNSPPGSGRGYMQIGQDPVHEKPVCVPKGHMAVYVGQKDGDFKRILVPVIYFNHPLFGELLRGAEEEYGFNHPGGITIPCRVSEFERVKTRIKSGRSSRNLLAW